MSKPESAEVLPPTNCSPDFDPIRVTIIDGAWKGEKGWITGPKNAVDANPITTDGGICLAWFDSEISKENDQEHLPRKES
jgi:hypothetical protein